MKPFDRFFHAPDPEANAPSLLFINRVFPPDHGASGRVLADLAERCARAGWRVTVLADGADPENQSNDSPQNAAAPRIVRTGKGLNAASGACGYLAALGRLLRRGLWLERHDVVVSLTDPPLLSVVGALLALLKGSAVVHWSHDLYPQLLPTLGLSLPRPIQAALTAAAAWVLRRHHCVIAIGRCMAARFAQENIAPERLQILPNWPDPRIVPSPPTRRDSENRPFIVAYSGNFGLAHPLSAVLDAAAILEKTAPDVRFQFIGTGRGRPRLEQALQNRPLASVSLHPWRPAERLSDTLAEADLHLATLAHDAEGLMVPCKVASALAAGRPCAFLGPSRSESAQMIRAERCGVTLAADDGAGLAREILALRNAPERWRAMAERAAQTGRAWTADRAAQTFLLKIAEPLSARKKNRRLLPYSILNKAKLCRRAY